MKTFTDGKRRDWTIEITWGSVKLIRSKLGIDINDVGEKGFLSVIADDTEKLVDMLWYLLEGQAKERDIDTISFAEGFAGETIDLAITCFMESLLEFFPEKKRQAIRKAWEKTDQVFQKGYQKIEKDIEAMDVDEILTEAFSKKT